MTEQTDQIVAPDAEPEVLPTARKRPEQIIAPLKPDEAPYDGDVLVVLAPQKTKAKYGLRMSVRPIQDKCPCKGRGWGVVETDDGSRLHRRAPGLCRCISQAVVRVCGAEAVIAAWAMSADDPVLVAWQGGAGRGMARQARLGMARPGMAWRGRHGRHDGNTARDRIAHSDSQRRSRS